MQNEHKRGVSKRCLNPYCDSPVVTHPKAVHARKFCCSQCRLDHWALRRVAELQEARNGQRDYSARRQKLRDSAVRVGEFVPIPLDQLVRIIKVWDRLKQWEPYKRLKKGNSQGRAWDEIVNPEVNLGEVS